MSGDTAIVSSKNGAYVYVRSGNSWTQQTVLVPSDGISVITNPYPTAISGNTVVIGANSVAVNGNANQGAVYVFIRNGTVWSQQQKLTTSDGAAGDQFGRSVSISGETILGGAWFDGTGANTNQDSGYVFVRQNGTWSEQTKLVANDGASNNLLGLTAFIDSDTAVLGTGISRSRVYIFTRSGTIWTQQQSLSVCEPSGSSGNSCNFGANGLMVSGDTLAVANNSLNIDTNTSAGGVYVFTRSGTTWTQQQRLTASDGLANDNFGTGLAIEGNTIVAGSPALNTRAGSAYLFSRAGSIWTQQQKFQISGVTASNSFGNSVSISGSKFIVATPRDITGIGAAYVFTSTLAQRFSLFDFDGDVKTDVGIFRPSPTEWWINRSSSGQTVAAQFGAGSDQITPADFTGDGKTDIAIFRPSTGEWFVLRSEDNSYFSFPFGTSGDKPVAADYDGDGKSDAAVFRPSTGTWFISNSGGSGTSTVNFGTPEDKPVAADYDGDGKSDIAIFRPSDGSWWYLRSSDLQFRVYRFGVATDKPVPGDYTGDGKADIAVFRPSNGEWFVQRSEDNSYFSFIWGQTGDVPVAGDYDGDGKFDTAIFRPSNSTWFINQTTAGIGIVSFGTSGDRPIPNAFVP